MAETQLQDERSVMNNTNGSIEAHYSEELVKKSVYSYMPWFWSDPAFWNAWKIKFEKRIKDMYNKIVIWE